VAAYLGPVLALLVVLGLGPAFVVPAPALPVPPRFAGPVPQTDSAAAPLLYSSAPDYPDANLQAILDSFLADAQGDWSASVKKLDTGQFASFNADEQTVSASLYKLFVFYEVLRQEKAGTFSLSDRLTITEEHAAYDRSLKQLIWTVGDKVRIEMLLDRMITVSDNTSALTLADLVGLDAINASIRRMGLEETHLDFGRGGDNMTTAAEYSTVLENLATGQLLDRQASRYMIDLLLAQQHNDLIPEGVPNGIPIAHKTGSLNGLRHDAGIVYGPNGPYVITVLSWNVTNLTTYTVMPKLSAAVYRYFNKNQFYPARYFPDTRQVAGPAFLLYYNRNGGQATFGQPIATEQTVGDRVVQYFERARMERPAAGGPVTLGAVGRELAEAEGRDFAPVADPDDPNTLWFTATRQALAQPFLTYWQQHGGEEIFGLPLSGVEIAQRDGQPVRVQYFERARLELQGDTIQIGPIGTELYQLKGRQP
jgi:beta-lactamase class A